MKSPIIKNAMIVVNAIAIGVVLGACSPNSSSSEAPKVEVKKEEVAPNCPYKISKADIDKYNSEQKFVRIIGFGPKIPCSEGSDAKGTSVGYDRLGILPGIQVYPPGTPTYKRTWELSILIPPEQVERELDEKYKFEKKFASLDEIFKDRKIWVQFNRGPTFEMSLSTYTRNAINVTATGATKNIDFSAWAKEYSASVLWEQDGQVFASISDRQYKNEFYWEDSNSFDLLDKVYARDELESVHDVKAIVEQGSSWGIAAKDLIARYPKLLKRVQQVAKEKVYDVEDVDTTLLCLGFLDEITPMKDLGKIINTYEGFLMLGLRGEHAWTFTQDYVTGKTDEGDYLLFRDLIRTYLYHGEYDFWFDAIVKTFKLNDHDYSKSELDLDILWELHLRMRLPVNMDYVHQLTVKGLNKNNKNIYTGLVRTLMGESTEYVSRILWIDALATANEWMLEKKMCEDDVVHLRRAFEYKLKKENYPSSALREIKNSLAAGKSPAVIEVEAYKALN
jgi:hypothetical protein